MTTKSKLPDKLSDLIEVAIKDLEACEKDSRYVVCMGVWHNAYPTLNTCVVCLAGAVMAKSLKGKSQLILYPCDFEETRQLEALDSCRGGDVCSAFFTLDLDQDKGVRFNRDIALYECDRKLFKSQMLDLAKDLREEGY